MRSLLFAFLLAFTTTATACGPEVLSPQQLFTVGYVAHVAPTFNKSAGFTLLLTGLLYQESSLCRFRRNTDDPSYGCGGVTPGAAFDVVGSTVNPWMLEHNDTLNINVSASRLSWCLSREHHDTALALVCYNSGPGVADLMTHKEAVGDAYVLAVTCRMRQLSATTRSKEP